MAQEDNRAHLDALDQAGAFNSFDSITSVAYLTAEASGWHDEPRSFGELIALIHSEASEALEEHRKGYEPDYVYYRESDNKPEGIAAELADIIIRVMDVARTLHIPLGPMLREKMVFNTTRPRRHGGKVL